MKRDIQTRQGGAIHDTAEYHETNPEAVARALDKLSGHTDYHGRLEQLRMEMTKAQLALQHWEIKILQEAEAACRLQQDHEQDYTLREIWMQRLVPGGAKLSDVAIWESREICSYRGETYQLLENPEDYYQNDKTRWFLYCEDGSLGGNLVAETTVDYEHAGAKWWAESILKQGRTNSSRGQSVLPGNMPSPHNVRGW